MLTSELTPSDDGANATRTGDLEARDRGLRAHGRGRDGRGRYGRDGRGRGDHDDPEPATAGARAYHLSEGETQKALATPTERGCCGHGCERIPPPRASL